MLAIRETLEKIKALDDNNRAIVVNLVDYLSDKQNKENTADEDRTRNVELLSEIITTQEEGDEDYVSETVVDNALRIIFHIIRQPRLFRTFENSIHMQFETEDRSYLEFEVFEDRMTCMLVPQRDYERALHPEVSLSDMKGINKIVGDFYGIE